MLLFDLDGTLMDSNAIWEQVDAQFLGTRGLQPTEEYSHSMGHSIFPVAAQLTKEYYHLELTTQAIMDEWLLLARNAYHAVMPKPGAVEFLARCRAQGERLAILTACVPELCHAVLGRHGLEGYFEQVIFAQELGLEKRNPQVFLEAATRLDVLPEACTLYEDAPANCAAAKSAGYRVVGVYDPFYHKYEAQMRTTCDAYIKGFSELLM